MKFQITHIKTRAAGFILASFIVGVSFQNCGKAGFDSALDSGLTSASIDPSLEAQFGSRDAVKVQNIPFAYDVIADTLSYSSCFGAGLQSKPGHFTFRIGAYANGGVKLRSNFSDYLKNNFQPIAPATALSENQIKNYLAYSPENAGAAPQFAIRTRQKPQVPRTNATSATSGIDFINMLTNLSDDRMMDPLVKRPDSVISYFPMAANPKQRFLEASLSYNTNEALAFQVRRDFMTEAQLGITFLPNGPSTPYGARMPASSTDTVTGVTDLTKAYGRGYNLTFSADVAPYTQYVYGKTVPNIYNPANILTAVQETNLENPASSNGSSWTCAAERRYVIVRQSDAPINCPKELPSAMNDASYRRELEIVRRQLRAENWDVNIALRCVVPKEGSCYANEFQGTTLIPIQYDQSQECFQGIPDAMYSNPASPPIKRCAQYVSICTRN